MKTLDLPGSDVGRRDEQPRRLAALHTVEIDQRLEEVAERVDVERIEPVGRGERAQGAGTRRKDCIEERQKPMISSSDLASGLDLAARRGSTRIQNSCSRSRAPSLPPRSKPSTITTAFIAPALVPGDRVEAEPAILEELVDHAPGEGAMGAAALEREVDRLVIVGLLRHGPLGGRNWNCRAAEVAASLLVLRPVLLERGKLVGAGLGLVARLPLGIGHAVDHFAGFVLGHREAAGLGRLAVPVGQAVPAEAGEVHQVDVLDVAALAEMLDEPPEGGGLEFGAGGLVEIGSSDSPGLWSWALR